MPMHSERRKSLRWTKIGPPLPGSQQEGRRSRRAACTGNQPALHVTAIQ